MNMTMFRPVYHALATGHHLTEVIVGLLLVALIFDGYALVVTVLGVYQWINRKLRTIDHPITAPQSPKIVR